MGHWLTMAVDLGKVGAFEGLDRDFGGVQGLVLPSNAGMWVQSWSWGTKIPHACGTARKKEKLMKALTG